jgi:hypothetical protein
MRRDQHARAVRRVRPAPAAPAESNGSRAALPIRDELTRTTLFLGENLNRNLDLLAIQKGISKGELIRDVMAQHLISQGFDPHRRPTRVNVEYAAEP